MRGLLLFTVFCLAAGQATADEPFVPPGMSPPDYVATVISQRRGKQIIAHHGEWTRVTTETSPADVSYYNGVASVSDAGWLRMFWRDGAHAPGIDREPRNTGERQVHLSESCTVWETVRSSSCITDDGIALWRRSGNTKATYSSDETVQIERRPLSDEDVKPPRQLLALDWWDHGISSSASKPDYETVMEFADDRQREPPTVRTTRRAGPWTFKQEVAGERRQTEISHDTTQMRLTYQTDESGVPNELTIYPERARLAPTALSKSLEPYAMDRHDTILGETCRWYHMNPGWRDSRTEACKTEDGIVLKEHSEGRGYAASWTVVRLTRRPVSLDEVRPPAELLMPRTWGLD